LVLVSTSVMVGEPPVTALDALAVHRLIDAVLGSSRDGRRINVDRTTPV